MALSNNIQHKSNFELLDMVNKKYKYNEEILITLLQELDKRHLSNDRIDELKKEISFTSIKTEIVKEETVSQEKEENTAVPQLYSIKALFMVAVFFSVFFSAILLAINLYKVNKKKNIVHLISLSFLFSLTVSMLIQSMGVFASIIGILLNVGGVFLLIKYFWLPNIGSMKYEKKSMLIPIIIGIIISIPLLILMYQQGITAM